MPAPVRSAPAFTPPPAPKAVAPQFNQALAASAHRAATHAQNRFGIDIKNNSVVQDAGHRIFNTSSIGTDDMGLKLYDDNGKSVSGIEIEGKTVPVKFKYMAYKSGDQHTIASHPVAVYKKTGFSFQKYKIEPELDRKGIPNYNGHPLQEFPFLQRDITNTTSKSLANLKKPYVTGEEGKPFAPDDGEMAWIEGKMIFKSRPNMTISRSATRPLENAVRDYSGAGSYDRDVTVNSRIFYNAENVWGISRKKIKGLRALKPKDAVYSSRTYDVLVPHALPSDKITAITGQTTIDGDNVYFQWPAWKIDLKDAQTPHSKAGQ